MAEAKGTMKTAIVYVALGVITILIANALTKKCECHS